VYPNPSLQLRPSQSRIMLSAQMIRRTPNG